MQPTLGNQTINRIGYGAMRLPGIRGTPENSEVAHELLHEAVALGANIIDTAGFYGAGLANRLIADALHPYPENLIISTKVGVKAGPSGRPEPAATPEEIRATVERDLESLRVPTLDLVFLRLPGGPLPESGVPMQESLECLVELQAEGLLKYIGLSSVTADQVTDAKAMTSVAAVQNALFVGSQDSQDVAKLCHKEGIPFLAYFPLGMGMLVEKNVDLGPLAKAHQATKAQIALAWLLALSPMVVPIPGTSNIDHLRENFAARNVVLSPNEIEVLTNA